MGGGDDMPISSGIMEETLADDVISSDSSSSCFSHCSFSDAQVAKSHCLLRMDEASELGEVVNSKPREEALMEETKSYGVFKNVKKKTKEPENQKDGIPEKKKSSRYLDAIDYHEKSSQRTSTVNLLQEAKSAIMSYKPGQWIEPAGHIPPSEYDVPSTTTLLLIGPRGSGKSSIVNSITRTFQDDDLIPDRAQVSYNLSSSEGTCFLQEYMIPRHSKAFCIYDSRSLSENTSDNFKLLKTWMTRGVRHREMVLRDSDSFSTKERIKSKVRHGCFAPCEKRRVDFAIFVVDGILVLKSMRSEDKQYTDILVEAFNYPFMSFGDHKPAVVVTHGDQLSFSERAEVCTHLGEILGIPPVKQIFDITDTTSPATELAIAELLRFALEQADRNLPCKQSLLLMTENMLQRVMDEAEHSTTWTATLEFFFIGFIILLLLHLFLR